MKELTAAVGGTYIRNPRWSDLLGRNVITVHPLGGCPMGRTAAEGVVDHRGRVFDPSDPGPQALHQGLLVADGSIIPDSLGVNPLLTISALSERIADLLIEDEEVNKNPIGGDLPAVVDIPPTVGMEFTEEMAGHMTEGIDGGETPQAYQKAEEQGKEEGRSLGFKLTVYIEDIDRFLQEPGHEARAEGSVVMGGTRYAVERGRFGLFAEGSAPGTKKMLYSLRFRGESKDWYLLDGYKEIRNDPGLDVGEIWKDLTTLFVTLHRGKSQTDLVIGKGIVRIRLSDLLNQLTTFRVRNAADARGGAEIVTRFMSFFFGEVWETYLKGLLPNE
jgi:cholesterol oxidase